MSETIEIKTEEAQASVDTATKKKGKTRSGAFGRFFRRTLLVIFTLVLLAAAALAQFMHTVFTGPSDTARETLTLVLSEYPATDWIPGFFLEENQVDQILNDQEG